MLEGCLCVSWRRYALLVLYRRCSFGYKGKRKEELLAKSPLFSLHIFMATDGICRENVKKCSSDNRNCCNEQHK